MLGNDLRLTYHAVYNICTASRSILLTCTLHWYFAERLADLLKRNKFMMAFGVQNWFWSTKVGAVLGAGDAYYFFLNPNFNLYFF